MSTSFLTQGDFSTITLTNGPPPSIYHIPDNAGRITDYYLLELQEMFAGGVKVINESQNFEALSD